MRNKSDMLENWLLFHKPDRQARIRLLCFSYAGGGASIFRPWLELLPKQIELWAVQLPGRENRLCSPPYSDINTLIAELKRVFLPHLAMPFALFGHSMGALIAFELARSLQTAGLPPVRLFVSGHRAPQLPAPMAPMHKLADKSFIAQISERYQSIPAQVAENEELLKLMLPGLRADFTLAETYLYREDKALDFPLLAFGGAYDKRVSQGEILAWAEHTQVSFAAHMFPGNHFFLREHCSTLVRKICKELSKSF